MNTLGTSRTRGLRVLVVGLFVLASFVPQAGLAQPGVPPKAPPESGPTAPAKVSALKGGKPQVAVAPNTTQSRATSLRDVVARLGKVEGNVLVSTPNGLVAGQAGMPLGPGSRVITTTQSSALINFLDGCIVPMTAYQRLEVNPTLGCSQRILLAQGLLIDQAGLAAALGGSTESIAVAAASGMPGSVGVLGGLGGAASLAQSQREETISPN